MSIDIDLTPEDQEEMAIEVMANLALGAMAAVEAHGDSEGHNPEAKVVPWIDRIGGEPVLWIVCDCFGQMMPCHQVTCDVTGNPISFEVVIRSSRPRNCQLTADLH